MNETIGVIFATTGKDYTELATRAAHSVKDTCPGLKVDLFTDQQIDTSVFDRIHQLEDPWQRSKIDAMAASRFEKTLYLDADIFVISDIRDVFDVLDRFDIALAHDESRNGDHAQRIWRKSLPNAFPQFNTGVIAFNRNTKVIELFGRWSVAVRENKFKGDQRMMRELLWESDLRVATLPREYNLMRLKTLYLWETQQSAPRIIHNRKLHKHFTESKARMDTLEDLLGPVIASKLPVLLSADRSLARMAGREARLPSIKETFFRLLRLVRDVPRHWFRRLR